MALKLYEIHDAIEYILAREVDTETGEVTDETLAKLDELEMERDVKALNVAKYLLSEQCEGEAVAKQAAALAERARRHKARAARLKSYLQSNLPEGEKLADDAVQIGWRKSTAVEVDDESKLPADVMRYTQSPDRTAIKAALKDGKDVPGARLVARMNLSVR